MQIVHRRLAQHRVLAVDPPDGALDLFAQGAVLLHPFTARARYLHQHGLWRPEPSLVEQLPVGGEPVPDALGVVEPVDPEQHRLGIR